jgi:hypothetical protein
MRLSGSGFSIRIAFSHAGSEKSPDHRKITRVFAPVRQPVWLSIENECKVIVQPNSESDIEHRSARNS